MVKIGHIAILLGTALKRLPSPLELANTQKAQLDDRDLSSKILNLIMKIFKIVMDLLFFTFDFPL